MFLTSKTGDHRSIQISRDTACSQSTILTDALPFSDLSAYGCNSVLRGVEMGHVHVQLHLITGFFAVMVCPPLPIRGIFMLMGIAGGKVSPTLEVLDTPPTSPPSDTQLDCKWFPSCVITRTQAQKLDTLSDSEAIDL